MINLTTFDFLEFSCSHEKSVPMTDWFELPSSKLRILDTGVIEILPNNYTSNRQIVISCGIHGNETAPIEILNAITNKILKGKLLPEQHILLIIGNPRAINQKVRFCDENLNRLFAGGNKSKKMNYEVERAKRICAILNSFYCHSSEKYAYDLHTAIKESEFEKFAIYPYIGKREHSIEQMCFFKECGIETVLLGNTPTTTFSFHQSSEYGAHAFTFELGKVRPFGENNLNDFAKLSEQLCQLIGTYKEFRICESFKEINLFYISQILIKTSNSFELNFPADIKNFSLFKKGEILATDEKNSWIAENGDERVVFANPKVPIGDWAAFIIRPVVI